VANRSENFAVSTGSHIGVGLVGHNWVVVNRHPGLDFEEGTCLAEAAGCTQAEAAGNIQADAVEDTLADAVENMFAVHMVGVER